jgi:hypothetical protein
VFKKEFIRDLFEDVVYETKKEVKKKFDFDTRNERLRYYQACDDRSNEK